MMDTQAPSNQDLVKYIKKEAASAGFYEAFLEATPQLILQMSLVLQTGNLSKYFL